MHAGVNGDGCVDLVMVVLGLVVLVEVVFVVTVVLIWW